jgi:hypothetical protein
VRTTDMYLCNVHGSIYAMRTAVTYPSRTPHGTLRDVDTRKTQSNADGMNLIVDRLIIIIIIILDSALGD